jgi:hypothetical protein
MRRWAHELVLRAALAAVVGAQWAPAAPEMQVQEHEALSIDDVHAATQPETVEHVSQSPRVVGGVAKPTAGEYADAGVRVAPPATRLQLAAKPVRPPVSVAALSSLAPVWDVFTHASREPLGSDSVATSRMAATASVLSDDSIRVLVASTAMALVECTAALSLVVEPSRCVPLITTSCRTTRLLAAAEVVFRSRTGAPT